MLDASHYIYNGSKQIEKERLRLLDKGTSILRSAALEGILPSNVNTILDVGCGSGSIGFDLIRRFPTAKLAGLDIDIAILSEATLRVPAGAVTYFAQGDAFALPFRAGSFDLVSCQYLLQHLPHPVNALCEIRRVTEPGGMLLVFEWDDGVNFSFPPMPALVQRLFAAKIALIHSKGGDRYIGRKLHQLIGFAGWKDVRMRIIHDIWEGPADRRAQLRGAELSMREIKPQLIANGLISHDDFENAIRQLYDYYCGDVLSVVFYFAAFATNPG
jgi:SAM-dependent methyltransferase